MSGFLGFWCFFHLQSTWPTTAVPGKYQWGICHCLWVKWMSKDLVTQHHPITVLLKGPRALSHCCSQHNKVHPWQQYRPLQVRPLIQTVQKWNLLGEGFSKSRVHTRCHQSGSSKEGKPYFFLYVCYQSLFGTCWLDTRGCSSTHPGQRNLITEDTPPPPPK